MEKVSQYMKQAEETKADIANAINKQLKAWKIPASCTEKDLGDKYTLIKKIDIDPKLTGPMAPIFTKITLEVRVGYATVRKVAKIALNYDYKHPNGQNGKDIVYEYANGKWDVY